MPKKFYNYFSRIYNTRKLLKREIGKITLEPKATVYFNSIRLMPRHFIMEINIMLLLIKQGYKIEVIIDDGVFEHTDTDCISSNGLMFYKVKFKVLKYRRFIEYYIWKLVIGNISQRLKFINASKIYREYGIKLQSKKKSKRNEFVQSSMIRFFNNEVWNSTKLSNWYEKITFNNVYISESIGIYVENKIKNIQSNIFITSHGIYSTYGPAYNEITQVKQRIVYGPNIYCIGSIQFFNNTQQFSFNEDSLRKFLENDLTNQQSIEADKFLSNRFQLKSKDTAVYFENNGLPETFQLIDRKSLPGKVFAAFPNVIWDGNINERDTVFNSIRAWVIELIEHFKINKKNSLIIRFHPAEATWMKGTVTFESTLVDALKNICEHSNIVIISSNKSFQSYDLLKKYADYALVYDGIIALEAPLFDVPVIFSGSGRFNVPNFGLQFNSKDEYMDYISDPFDYQFIERDKEISKKLIYYYTIYNSYYFPVLDNKFDDNSYDEGIFLRNPNLIENSSEAIYMGIKRCLEF